MLFLAEQVTELDTVSVMYTHKRCVCLCLSYQVFVGLMATLAHRCLQYIEPTIRNSVKPMKEQKWALIVERVLKLAIPTLYIWLVMFYALFHVWLNIVAEVLQFGDREFYKVSRLLECRTLGCSEAAVSWRAGSVIPADWDRLRSSLTGIPLLAGLVECYHDWRLLAAVEHASAQGADAGHMGPCSCSSTLLGTAAK
jgi:hypothetical protein